MSIPALTHLQFLILNALRDADRSGRDLRAELAAAGNRMSLPAFYQFMARLEDAKLVSGRYVSKVVDRTSCRERWYHVLRKGISAHDATLAFYADRGVAAS